MRVIMVVMGLGVEADWLRDPTFEETRRAERREGMKTRKRQMNT